MIKKVTKFQTDDGTIFDTFKEAVNHAGYYICPKCNGKGNLVVRYNAYPSNLPDSGWVADIKTKEVICDLCKGDGYTEKKFKQKMKAVGWEEIYK